MVVSEYPKIANCIIHRFQSREEWKQMRIKGIGGSDVSAILNLNPWKSNQELWREKRGIKSSEFEPSPAMEYGTLAEEHIRQLFALDNPNYIVYYEPNVILQSIDNPELLYSPDGLLYDIESDKWGVLEIKTSQLQNGLDWKKWDNIPGHYYPQVIQGLLVTGFDFVVMCAELKNYNVKGEYWQFTRKCLGLVKNKAVESDMAYQLKEVKRFWKSVQSGKEPALQLPEIGGL